MLRNALALALLAKYAAAQGTPPGLDLPPGVSGYGFTAPNEH